MIEVNLTPCQELALDALEGAQNVFLTGGAGSGKSFLVRHFLQDKNSKDFPVLASTGAAAVLVGGRTFHSFFGLGIMEGGPEETIERVSKNRQVLRRLKKISGFIVDEVSMLSGPTLRVAEVVCRRARNSDLPWGGLKVITVGDFAQLPPVERSYSRARPWAFLDEVWRWSNFRTCYLQTSVRSRDDEYIKILKSIRNGQVTREVTDYLNSKVVPVMATFNGTRLFPRREETDRFNLVRLQELETPIFEFVSIYSGAEKAVEQLKKHSPIAEVITLKEGALIMLRQNDPQGRWVNGSTGWITKINPYRLSIRLLNGRQVEIEKVSFSMMDAEGNVVASAINFPVSLAYATTIHKAQGSTLDRMFVNLSNLWEPGQAYVALSRIGSGADLCIEKWSPQSIKVDPQVVEFYRAAEQKMSPINAAHREAVFDYKT